MNRSLLSTILEGQPAFREKQILKAVYQQKKTDWDSITELPADLRERLKVELPILTITPKNKVVSRDGTIKTLFEAADGALVEAVMIPNKEFRTVCVSSQVGCAMACTFCATGTLGLKRNLTADEIADQVLYYEQILAERGESVSNVVYMGMGEPLANLTEVLASVDILNDANGLNIGARHISISTSGLVPGILMLAKHPKQINLAISIHAPNTELRSSIMPVNDLFPLAKLMQACETYVQTTRRKLMFEYVMLSGVNDSLDHARAIAALLKPLSPRVLLNLIPFHQTFLQFSTSSGNRIHAFQREVEAGGVPCHIRHSAGVDVDAACGQLARTAYDR